MANSPLIWNVGESILIDLTVLDPNTGLGLPGQVNYITLTIQKTTGQYWNNSNWITATVPPTLSFTEVDPIYQPGRYTYILSAGANSEACKYIAHVKIDNFPILQGDTYEVHVSRVLNVYDMTPDDC